MNQNIWLDERAMAILMEARDKLQQLGAVCEITPAQVPGEGVVAALYASYSQRGLQAGLEAHDVGVAKVATGDHTVLAACIDRRLRTREFADAVAQRLEAP